MICVLCKKEIAPGEVKAFPSGKSHEWVYLHPTCYEEYEKLNQPKPQTFRERLRKYVEKEKKIHHDIAWDDKRHLLDRQFHNGADNVLKNIISWLEDNPDDSLTQFKKKLKECLEDEAESPGGGMHVIDMHQLDNWIDEN